MPEVFNLLMTTNQAHPHNLHSRLVKVVQVKIVMVVLQLEMLSVEVVVITLLLTIDMQQVEVDYQEYLMVHTHKEIQF